MWPMNFDFRALWGLYEFSRAFTAEGATNRSGAAKIVSCSHYAASFLRYPEMCGLWKFTVLVVSLTSPQQVRNKSVLRSKLVASPFTEKLRGNCWRDTGQLWWAFISHSILWKPLPASPVAKSTKYALRAVGHGLSLEHVLSELHKKTFINRMIFTDCY